MADDERSPEIAGWLEVEPLDDVTRRRLVSSALRETETADASAPARPSRTWRWIAAAAALVIVAVGTLAVVSANGGHDENQQATGKSLSPGGLKVAHDVGNFGDLDKSANLTRLRTALGSATAAPSAAAPTESADASAQSRESGAAADRPLDLCGSVFPGGTVLALGSGTIDGRHASVFLVQQADGSRSLEAVLDDPCETRHLGSD
jgi:hypothetical protein